MACMVECESIAEMSRHRIQPDLASEQRLRRVEPLAELSDLYRRQKTASPGRRRFCGSGSHQQIGLHSRSVCVPANANAHPPLTSLFSAASKLCRDVAGEKFALQRVRLSVLPVFLSWCWCV
jgi:hypothetical protein